MIKTLAFIIGFLFVFSSVGAPSAQEEDLRPRAFVGRYIQLDPIMAPFQTGRGIRYEIVTVRLVIGENSTARYACWVAPKMHEEIMFYLWDKTLTTADFEGERKAEMSQAILKFVSDKTDPKYYAAVEFAGGFEEMDEDSSNLSTLCK